MRHRPPSTGDDGHVDDRDVMVLSKETTGK